MQQPLKFLRDAPAAAAVVAKFAQRGCPVGLSYATVRDYCESVDDLPQIAPTAETLGRYVYAEAS